MYQYPKALIFSEPIIAMSAVAPPGGCRAFSICMAMMELATATAQVSQKTSKYPMVFSTVTPMKALTVCPRMRFRGWAKGLCVAPYTKTAVAPKEPIRKTWSIGEKS